MLELKFVIHHRAVSLSSQASSVAVRRIVQSLSQQWMKKTLPASMHSSNSAILSYNYTFQLLSDSCTCTNEENGVANEAI